MTVGGTLDELGKIVNRPAHVDFLNGLNSKGTLKFAGPFLDGESKPCGSLVVIEANDLASAKEILGGDPYAKAGLFATTEVIAWNWVFNKAEGK